MSQTVELNPGEVKVNISTPLKGKVTFKDLGLNNEDLVFEGGLLRLVFDFAGLGDHNYYMMPTVEIGYAEEMGETHWQCDFNGETILDTTDHHGHTTVLLMKRDSIQNLEQHHENALIVHGEFPNPVHVLAEKSYVRFF